MCYYSAVAISRLCNSSFLSIRKLQRFEAFFNCHFFFLLLSGLSNTFIFRFMTNFVIRKNPFRNQQRNRQGWIWIQRWTKRKKLRCVRVPNGFLVESLMRIGQFIDITSEYLSVYKIWKKANHRPTTILIALVILR